MSELTQINACILLDSYQIKNLYKCLELQAEINLLREDVYSLTPEEALTYALLPLRTEISNAIKDYMDSLVRIVEDLRSSND